MAVGGYGNILATRLARRETRAATLFLRFLRWFQVSAGRTLTLKQKNKNFAARKCETGREKYAVVEFYFLKLIMSLLSYHRASNIMNTLNFAGEVTLTRRLIIEW